AGTARAAAGTLALNQYMERDLDARMERTRRRPLPEGRLHAAEALTVGLVLLTAGLLFLAGTTNAVATLVTAGIAVTYLLLYTPLKRVSSLCSLVGAVPGALPPVAGWAAARGALGPEPWILFAIMFLWQIPHTLALGRMYRDDYARAGIRVLTMDAASLAMPRRTVRSVTPETPPLISNARLAMLVLIAGESMLFAGLIGMYLVFRLSAREWPPANLPRLPLAMTVANTFVL